MEGQRQRNNTRMDNKENTLAIPANETPVLPELANGAKISAVNAKYKLVGARLFVALNAGLEPSAIKKQTMAQVIALAIANGATEKDCATWRSEFNALEAKHEKISRATIAVYASSQDWKSKMSLAVNAKGVVIGANASFRRLGVKSAIARLALADARIAKLEAQVALNSQNALPA